MFTGIIAALGRIRTLTPLADGVRLTIEAAGLGLEDVALGDSVAVNGVCLTVVRKDAAALDFEVSGETLRCTVGLDAPGEVNLEKAMRVSDRLGGHLVSGHVDGVGEVVRFEPVGESMELVVRAPAELARYIARKGSVTVNGVSLTTNRVQGAEFSINLIPHTLEATNLKHLKAGSRVNVEVDLLARYLERLLEGREEGVA